MSVLKKYDGVFDTDLFKDPDDGHPMHFILNVKNTTETVLKKIVELVRHCGAEVSFDLRDATTHSKVITDHSNDIQFDGPQYCIGFIHDCLQKNKLLNIDLYRHADELRNQAHSTDSKYDSDGSRVVDYIFTDTPAEEGQLLNGNRETENEKRSTLERRRSKLQLSSDSDSSVNLNSSTHDFDWKQCVTEIFTNNPVEQSQLVTNKRELENRRPTSRSRDSSSSDSDPIVRRSTRKILDKRYNMDILTNTQVEQSQLLSDKRKLEKKTQTSNENDSSPSNSGPIPRSRRYIHDNRADVNISKDNQEPSCSRVDTFQCQRNPSRDEQVATNSSNCDQESTSHRYDPLQCQRVPSHHDKAVLKISRHDQEPCCSRTVKSQCQRKPSDGDDDFLENFESLSAKQKPKQNKRLVVKVSRIDQEPTCNSGGDTCRQHQRVPSNDDDDFFENFESATLKQESKQNKHTKLPYTFEERCSILRYIVHHKQYSKIKGRELWLVMERRKVCPIRTWQSMKEHFLKKIAPDLNSYPFLTDENKRCLNKFLP